MNETFSQSKCGGFVYYCTLGRGMDPFVKAELAQIDGVVILKVIEGKIFFSSSSDLGEFKLDTAERILLLVHHQKQDINSTDSQPLALFNLQRILTETANWEESLRIWRLARGIDPKSEEPTSARLNIKVTGSMRKLFKPDRLAGSLNKRLKHSIKLLTFVLRNAEMSIDIHVSDSFITTGLALSSASQAFGGPQHGLRSTTAKAMAMCLTLGGSDTLEFFKDPVCPASVILDPMCGKGSILGAFEPSNLVIIGVDNDKSQLDFSIKNNPRALVIQGDARKLPFLSNTVDKIVCDLPFGLKYSKGDFKELIPQVLCEMRRVIKNNGRAVILFARSEQQFLEQCSKDCGFSTIKTLNVMLGVLEAVIFVFG